MVPTSLEQGSAIVVVVVVAAVIPAVAITVVTIIMFIGSCGGSAVMHQS